MLSKCSNPSCSAVFRHLKDGKLFLLENDPLVRSSRSKREEYFWLCPECAATMTLRLGKHGEVGPVALPLVIQGKPEGVAVHSEERKAGLFLHGVSSPKRELGSGRRRGRRLNPGQHAA